MVSSLELSEAPLRARAVPDSFEGERGFHSYWNAESLTGNRVGSEPHRPPDPGVRGDPAGARGDGAGQSQGDGPLLPHPAGGAQGTRGRSASAARRRPTIRNSPPSWSTAARSRSTRTPCSP